ncbi:MAG: hypothetical protein ACRENC_11950, partial [Gemmatimonadaceae bacterium]
AGGGLVTSADAAEPQPAATTVRSAAVTTAVGARQRLRSEGQSPHRGQSRGTRRGTARSMYRASES